MKKKLLLLLLYTFANFFSKSSTLDLAKPYVTSMAELISLISTLGLSEHVPRVCVLIAHI